MSGVGYVAPSSTSRYQLDTLVSPYQSHQMDRSADPGAVGAAPNPFYLNLGDPAVREAYERRYGPNTAGQRFKRFAGGGNEVKSIWAQALSWWHNTTTAPTEVEVLDALATNDVQIPRAWMVATQPGWSPERRNTINDPSLPHGEGSRQNTFWGITEYYFNDAEQAIDPPPPPVDDPPANDPPGPVVPPPHVCPPAWQPLPGELLRLIGVSDGWNGTAWGPGKIRGIRRAFALLRDYDARQKAATS